MRQVLRRDSHTSISNPHFGLSATYGPPDGHAASRPGVLARVVQQVQQKLEQQVFVSAQHDSGAWLQVELNVPPLHHGAHLLDCGGDQLGQVDRFGRDGDLASVGASQRQQASHQADHAVHLFVDHLKDLPVRSDIAWLAHSDLNLTLDRRQRRPELVRGVSRELTLAPEGRVQARDHLVECPRQPSDLVVRQFQVKPLAEVLGRDAARQAGQPVDGGESSSRQEDTSKARHGQSQRVGGGQDDQQDSQRVGYVTAGLTHLQHAADPSILLDRQCANAQALVTGADVAAARFARQSALHGLSIDCDSPCRNGAVKGHPTRGIEYPDEALPIIGIAGRYNTGKSGPAILIPQDIQEDISPVADGVVQTVVEVVPEGEVDPRAEAGHDNRQQQYVPERETQPEGANGRHSYTDWWVEIR